MSVATLSLLAGCIGAATPLGPTVQVMPGPGKSFDVFQADNSSCKTFADGQVKGQADAANQRAVGAAVLTTVLGAGLGAAGGNTGVGAAVGAGGGALLGTASASDDQVGIQAQYDTAFSQCMYSKGEQVPGYAPVRAVVTAPIAVPDPVVRATQTELIRLGYLAGGADGFSGPKTRTAIAGFQQASGLPTDGVSSPRLLARLQATPTNAAASPVAATAPSAWVAPATVPAATPVSAPAAWVAPAR